MRVLSIPLREQLRPGWELSSSPDDSLHEAKHFDATERNRPVILSEYLLLYVLEILLYYVRRDSGSRSQSNSHLIA
jgi:hypothetical protein